MKTNKQEGDYQNEEIKQMVCAAAGVVHDPFPCSLRRLFCSSIRICFDSGIFRCGRSHRYRFWQRPRSASLLPTVEAEYFVGVANTIEEGLEAQGFEFITTSYDWSADKEIQAVENFVVQGVDAIVVITFDAAADSAFKAAMGCRCEGCRSRL